MTRQRLRSGASALEQAVEFVQHGPQLTSGRRQPVEGRDELGPLPLDPGVVLEETGDDILRGRPRVVIGQA